MAAARRATLLCFIVYVLPRARVKDGHFFLAAVPESCSKAKMKADLAALSNEHGARIYKACVEILR